MPKPSTYRPPPCASPAPPGHELPRPRYAAGAEPVGHARPGHARASTARQSLDSQLDSLTEAGVTRIFSEKISTRATQRPELDKAVALAGGTTRLRGTRHTRRPRAQAARPRHRTGDSGRGTEGERRRPGVPHR
ncbi:recombinase family protein [Streptomyces decoyicus]|uniref:recombinase family protein n=1 Tax=Streptomyces decoyicus TaxID=249567 RepID=UPI0033F01348